MCKEFAQQFVIHTAELHAHLEDLAFLSSLTLKVPTVPKPEVRPCCSRLTLYTPSPTQPQIHTNTGAHTFISHMLPSDMVPACLFGLFYDHNQQPDRHSAFQQAATPPATIQKHSISPEHLVHPSVRSWLAVSSTIIQSHAYAQWRSSRATGHVEIVLYASSVVCDSTLKDISVTCMPKNVSINLICKSKIQ